MSTRRLTDHLRFMFEIEGATVKEIAATRRLLECGLIPAVVAHAYEHDFQRMQIAIDRSREHTERGDPFTEADMAFHPVLATATKNRLTAGFCVIIHALSTHIRKRIEVVKTQQLQ